MPLGNNPYASEFKTIYMGVNWGTPDEAKTIEQALEGISALKRKYAYSYHPDMHRDASEQERRNNEEALKQVNECAAHFKRMLTDVQYRILETLREHVENEPPIHNETRKEQARAGYTSRKRTSSSRSYGSSYRSSAPFSHTATVDLADDEVEYRRQAYYSGRANARIEALINKLEARGIRYYREWDWLWAMEGGNSRYADWLRSEGFKFSANKRGEWFYNPK